jgi:uncharacterized protein (UPF0333 family)
MKKYFGAMLVLALFAVGVVGYFYSVSFTNSIRAHRAEKIGHIYIEKVYKEYSILGEICQGVDTDGNGYVSCTYRIGKGEAEKEINLQCPTYIKSFLGNECKATQMVIPN